MAEFRPNEAQARAIKETGKNILVSAGAGSGKTTVLVERVIRMIIEEQVDIDSLIIVTFTKAAAANMKEKIYSRIRAAIKNDTLSEEIREHLKGQMLRVFSSRICTIDALCMEIVRENFQYVDIDPAFRLADEAEITLLIQDVLAEMIEAHYSEPTEEFLEFVNYYTDKNDAKLDNIILTLYRFSQSHPDPELWLKRAVGPYVHAGQLGNTADEAENNWIFVFAKIIDSEIKALKQKAEKGLSLCDRNYGPIAYTDNFTKVLQEITELSQYSFDGRCFFLNDILENWSRLSSVKKKDEVSEDLKKQAQTLYGELREGLSNLKERFFYQTLEEMYLDMGKCAKVAKTIMELTLEFSRRFAEEKKARLIADFNDVAHFALGVLMQRDEDGNPVYTAAADSIAKATREIIIDEYQDTNRMQDALIGALSAERFGRPNVFMVGDVKQSIYGFRLACPDLFIEKYNEYQDPSGNGRRIILGENYRSRKEIVDFINLVFEKIMLAEVGGIDYLDGNIMICGASFPEPWDARQVTPEILFVEGSGDSGKDAESFLIAEKIEEITESYYVTGKDGTLRKARYSDIAILTRKTNNPRLEKMLTDRHIPVKKSSSKGFFGSFEIRLAMDLLKVIDNPLQDIPLAAVLLSPVAGLDANTLARIKISSEKEPFCLYSACLAYSEDEEKEGAKELREFLSKLKEWRGLAEGIGINSFLNLVLEESGLYDCSAAMTYGEGRTANLDFLKNLASGFSKGSYRGLFNFIRYIDAIQKADQDFGSGQISGNEDAVTLMTIHKSKGLEFPVVILADCGKTILDQDSASPVYLDDVLGLGIELRDLETRIKRKTLLMETIAIRKKTSLLAEEIRLLYVAMSRAKEKLIITGAKGNLSARRREWENPEFPPDAGSVRSDNSYMYLLGDAMRCEPSSQGAGFVWTVQDLEEVEIERAAEIFNEKERRERVREMISRSEAEQKKSSDCKEPQLDVASKEGQAEEKRISPAEAAGIYDYEYPWLSATRTNVKVTASQMENHESDRETKEETYRNFRPEKEAGLSGAERGNAYHKLFELLDYHAADKAFQKAGWNKKVLTMEVSETETLFREAAIEFALSEIERLKNSGHLSQKAAKSIVPEKIADFLLSELGGRMREAALSGNLRREQQFVMAAEIDGNPDGLMQGIIDAFFIEDKNGERRVILVDYKTDRRKTTDDFVQTYQGQQEGYARALEAALGIPVTERLLYSVELNQVIRL